MDTKQKTELYLKLLEITAVSRFSIMKEIWNLQSRIRPLCHDPYKDAISESLTKLRQEIFETLLTDAAFSSDEFVMQLATCSDLPQIKKNIAMLAMTGLNEECIAAMNCVNNGYVRMNLRTLREDFPEIFAEM